MIPLRKAALIAAGIAAVSVAFSIGVVRAQTRPQPSTNIVGDYFAVVTRPGTSEPTETPQTQSRPAGTQKWEAVSVRPCLPPASQGPGPRGGGPTTGPFRFSPDRMTLNCLSVRSLIRSAYHVYFEPGLPGPSSPMDIVLISGLPLVRDGKNPTDGTDGGPDWIDTDGYTIEAKAEGVTDRALMQGPMLQAILEDRFKIKVHRETREIAVDALVIARGGSKLKPFVEGSCVRRSPDRNSTPQLVWLHIKADVNGKLSGTLESRQIIPLTDVRVEGQSLSFGGPDGFSWKGSIENDGALLNGGLTGRGSMPLVFTRVTAQTPVAQQRDCRVERGGLKANMGNTVYHAEGFTLDEFAKLFLSGYRARFVIDKTGLTGKFDIHLESEIGAEVRQRADPSGDLFGPSMAPPLPEALQQQLGLRLESTKGPVEFLVIDHIERPSPN
jgi:uncharacterized protein (TIGR03435 family)